MADDQISEQGRQARFARWEQIGVDRIKADLLSGGRALVGGPPAVRRLAWEWVRMKEQEAKRQADEIVTLRPAVYGVGVDLRALWRKLWGGSHMRYPTKRFKSLSVALKELEPFIRDAQHLQTGKPFDKFGGLRSRELVANWLLCATINAESGSDHMTFTSDPIGGDGIIYNTATEDAYPTEHVLVPEERNGAAVDAEARILEAIERKRSKGGAAYASGKSLVVFLNAGGGVEWFPNRVAQRLPAPLHFAVVWVVGLHQVQNGEYVYGVTQMDVSEGNAMMWHVHIGKEFDTWWVEAIQ